MKWTEEERRQLALEYARIGVQDGEPLPTPARMPTPGEFLALLRHVPSGAGAIGIRDAMARPTSEGRADHS
jgi:hypothetical protein